MAIKIKIRIVAPRVPAGLLIAEPKVGSSAAPLVGKSLRTSTLQSSPVMEYAAFHVVYVDKRISVDLDGRYLQKAALGSLAGADWSLQADRRLDGFQQTSSEIAQVQDNLHNLLANFDGGKSGTNCLRVAVSPHRVLPSCLAREGSASRESWLT